MNNRKIDGVELEPGMQILYKPDPNPSLWTRVKLSVREFLRLSPRIPAQNGVYVVRQGSWEKPSRQFDSLTFEEAWAEMEARGYQYGDDAKEQVHLGWKMAQGYRGEDPEDESEIHGT